MWLLLLVTACGAGPTDPAPGGALEGFPEPDPTCSGIYGAPNDNTGLDGDSCTAEVAGAEGTWTPPAWDEATLAALRAWTLLDPPAVPEQDPYAHPDAVLAFDPLAVCAVVPQDGGAYRLISFTIAAEARASGGVVTHGDSCGLCSSLADLAVYAGIPDLTQPVRQCGLAGVLGGLEATDACLQELGFTPPCARIWAYNAQHTQDACFDICMAELSDPYNQPDGSLNDCLQCDEDESGPVFQAVAGRTRRNSGLATALCRPCETVWRVGHRYSPP